MDSNQKLLIIHKQQHYSPLQGNLRKRMFTASVLCCVLGIVLTGVTDYPLPMLTFFAVLLCIVVTWILFRAGKISADLSCLIPIVLMCFVLTPVCWFSLDGLFGCTPYFSMVFIAVIILTFFERLQRLLLGLYFLVLAGLSVYSIMISLDTKTVSAISYHMVGYFGMVVLQTFFLILLQKKYAEISECMVNYSIRDELTGLYNRRVLEQILDLMEKLYEKGSKDYGVIMLDIDNFKMLNDQHGHMLGDAVLKDLGERIKDCVRTSDFSLRYGGDEFLIVLPDIDKQSADQIIDRIENHLRKTYEYSVSVSVSKGCALRSECGNADDLIALADMRMYEDKNDIHPKADGSIEI